MAVLVREDRAAGSGSGRYTRGPAGLVHIYMAVLQFSSGKNWGNMFAQMNSGLGDAQTGLMINGQNLGLLEDVVSGAGKRARTKGPPAQGAGAAGNPQPLPAESPLIVHWGPALAARRLCAGGSSQAGLEQRLMTAFVEKAAETPVQWPANDA